MPLRRKYLMFVVPEKWKDLGKLYRLIFRSLSVNYFKLFLEPFIYVSSSTILTLKRPIQASASSLCSSPEPSVWRMMLAVRHEDCPDVPTLFIFSTKQSARAQRNLMLT